MFPSFSDIVVRRIDIPMIWSVITVVLRLNRVDFLLTILRR